MNSDERTVMALRELYSAYGYWHYKVSKFESYDLYASNRNFLQSKQILTFTDTNGRLMALKPDVTLSIIKNIKPDTVISKVYYTENVYRVPKNADGFQEIMQTGLELIGRIDDYAMAEVVMLAERSLRTISPDYVLELSHIGVISGLLDEQNLDQSRYSALMAAVEEKNRHELRALCSDFGLSERVCDQLIALVGLYGPLEAVLDELEAMELPAESRAAAASLRRLSRYLALFGCNHLRLDFSLVNDMDYYNGLVFRGFISGVAAGVLSGGRYDNLMAKMGRSQGAVGFAVYLDQLERFFARRDAFDADVALYYTQGDPDLLIAKAMEFTGQGMRVLVLPEGSAGMRVRKSYLITGSEVQELG